MVRNGGHLISYNLQVTIQLQVSEREREGERKERLSVIVRERRAADRDSE
jgi:hypothetical protein